MVTLQALKQELQTGYESNSVTKEETDKLSASNPVSYRVGGQERERDRARKQSLKQREREKQR